MFMERFKLRRWRNASSMDAILLFSCAWPGRSLRRRSKVCDEVVMRGVDGLPGKGKISLISLMGCKPDGTDEHSFYSLSTAMGFQKWLEKHSSRVVRLFHFPTTDFQPVPSDTCAASRDRIHTELKESQAVIIVDSCGIQRTGQVCRDTGFIEDTRTLS